MSNSLSSRQSAKLVGVSKSTIKRLCDTGALACSRTPGGHRRIQSSELLDWATKQGITVRLDPGPMREAHQSLTVTQVQKILMQRDSQALATQIIRAVQFGSTLREVFDDLVAPALWEVGKLWEQSKLDPYEEHLCSETVRDALAHVSSRMGEMRPQSQNLHSANIAIGGVVGTELHHLASLMIELTLSYRGWRAQSLGAMVPCESLIRAARELVPKLIWVGYTCVDDVDSVLYDNHRLFSSLQSHQRLVLGGPALTRELRRRLKFHFVGDSLNHLMEYVSTLEGANSVTSSPDCSHQ